MTLSARSTTYVLPVSMMICHRPVPPPSTLAVRKRLA
jgi:hypothetical protein